MLLPQKIKIPKDLEIELQNYVSQISTKNICSQIYSQSLESDIISNENLSLEEDSSIYELDIINKINNTKLSDTFQELLFKFIDKSGLNDSDVYRKAFIDRRLFSKIRSNKDYHPSFGTVTLLALSLKLSTKEYEELLHSASYSLATNSYANITLKYCFDNSIYDVATVNNLVYTVTNREVREL